MADEESDPFEWLAAQKRELAKSRDQRLERSRRRKNVILTMLRDVVSQALGTAMGAALVLGAGAVFGLIGSLRFEQRLALGGALIGIIGGLGYGAWTLRWIEPESSGK